AVVAPPASVELTVDAVAGDWRARAAAEIRRPFDLAAGPLFRALLMRTGPDHHVLLLTLHHLVGDGWSRRVLLADLAALAAGAALEPFPMQFSDHARRERAAAGGRRMADDLAWWTARFAEPPPVLDLPTDRPAPPVQGFDGGQFRRR